MDYLIDEMNAPANENSDIGNYCFKSQEFSNKRLRLGLLIPFKLDKKQEYTFLVKNLDA